jgi:hypothetical protein
MVTENQKTFLDFTTSGKRSSCILLRRTGKVAYVLTFIRAGTYSIARAISAVMRGVERHKLLP